MTLHRASNYPFTQSMLSQFLYTNLSSCFKDTIADNFERKRYLIPFLLGNYVNSFTWSGENWTLLIYDILPGIPSKHDN